jgi:hypothetical protein
VKRGLPTTRLLAGAGALLIALHVCELFRLDEYLTTEHVVEEQVIVNG